MIITLAEQTDDPHSILAFAIDNILICPGFGCYFTIQKKKH